TACPSFKSEPAKFAGQLAFERVRVYITHRVEEAMHLFLGGLDDARVGMTGCGHAEGGGEVEVPLAFSIPDVNAFRAVPQDRPGAVRRDEGDVRRFVTLKERQRLAGSHAWIKHPFAR